MQRIVHAAISTRRTFNSLEIAVRAKVVRALGAPVSSRGTEAVLGRIVREVRELPSEQSNQIRTRGKAVSHPKQLGERDASSCVILSVPRVPYVATGKSSQKLGVSGILTDGSKATLRHGSAPLRLAPIGSLTFAQDAGC